MKKLFALAFIGLLVSGSAFAQCCPGDCCVVPGKLKNSELAATKNYTAQNSQVFGIRINDKTGKLELVSKKKDILISQAQTNNLS